MIELPRAIFDELVDHALEGRPMEVCGALGGRFDPDVTSVTSRQPANNVAADPRTEFAIDPAEQLEIIDRIEETGDDVCGFYHSHPAGPASPSETDTDRATWPGLSYVIVVLGGKHPNVGSWRWDGDAKRFEPEAIRIG